MALNPQEFERLKQLTVQGKQKLDIKKAQEPKPAPKDDFFQVGDFKKDIAEAGQDIRQTGAKIKKQVVGSGQKIFDISQDKGLTFGEKLRGGGAELFRGAVRAGVEEPFLGVGKLLLSEKGEEKAKNFLQSVGEKVGQREDVQSLITKFQNLPPDAKRELKNAAGFAEFAAEIFTFGQVKRFGKIAVEEAGKQISKKAEDVAGIGVAGVGAVKGAVKGVTGDIVTLAKKAEPAFIKKTYQSLTPKNKKEAISASVDAYQSSFVTNNAAMNKALAKQAKAQSFGDTKVTSDDLIRNVATEGIIPDIQGDLANFNNAIADIITRQNAVMENVTPILARITEQTPLATLRLQALAALKASPQIIETLPQSKRQLESFFTGIQQKFGDTLSAVEVAQVQRAMNGRTKAFGEEAFKQDTANILASVARSRIDELAPSLNVKNATAEWGRLKEIRNTVELFNFKKISIGDLGNALGRWTGVVTLAATGLGAVSGGVGGLVVAGIAAKLGGDAFAQFLRNRKFSKKTKDLIIQGIRQDDEIVQKLINEVNEADRSLLEQVLLKPPSETPILQQAKGQAVQEGARVVPAPKGQPGRTP
ncbi:hypothetical protein LCGC14_1904240, partial [marine sediment metagenome]